jgi:hypothetical protein
MVMSLRPDLVPANRPHRDGEFQTDPAPLHAYRTESHTFWRDINGFTDSPDIGTAAKGDIFRAAVVKGLARTFIEFYRS